MKPNWAVWIYNEAVKELVGRRPTGPHEASFFPNYSTPDAWKDLERTGWLKDWHRCTTRLTILDNVISQTHISATFSITCLSNLFFWWCFFIQIGIEYVLYICFWNYCIASFICVIDFVSKSLVTQSLSGTFRPHTCPFWTCNDVRPFMLFAVIASPLANR